MKRLHLLDIIRGFALINMIVYHALWDLVYIFGKSIPWYRSAAADSWQMWICCTFILLSGFCFSLGGNKLRRALIVLASSLLISLVTIFLIPSNTVMFGVLSLIGSGMLLLVLFEKPMKKLGAYPGFIISLLLFIVLRKISFPAWWHINTFTAYLGFPPVDFFSVDYFPLVPWLFLYIAGFYLHKMFKRQTLNRWLSTTRIPPLEWLGRHSLIIYLLHQPVIYGIFYVIFSII